MFNTKIWEHKGLQSPLHNHPNSVSYNDMIKYQCLVCMLCGVHPDTVIYMIYRHITVLNAGWWILVLFSGLKYLLDLRLTLLEKIP